MGSMIGYTDEASSNQQEILNQYAKDNVQSFKAFVFNGIPVEAPIEIPKEVPIEIPKEDIVSYPTNQYTEEQTPYDTSCK